MPLTSLRLTVVLFAMAIFLVFAGTLAQVDKDIWEVMNQYFRAFFAWIDFQIFFPKSFFSGEPPKVPGGFPFPGGWLIGGAMGINLLSAHALRFKVQARGAAGARHRGDRGGGRAHLDGHRRRIGQGHDRRTRGARMGHAVDRDEAEPRGAVAFRAWVLSRLERSRKVEIAALSVGEIVLGGVLAWIFWYGADAALGDSSMRILWQLIKGGLAGLVLLAGCVLLFRKRAGIVLLHGGIALVMINELVVHTLHVEGQMPIKEGETVNYVMDIRAVELAVIDPSDPKTDDVVVIPAACCKAKNRFATRICHSTCKWSSICKTRRARPSPPMKRIWPRPAPA